MIYDDILDGILIAEKLGKAVPLSYNFDKTPKIEKKQKSYLISLKPAARKLWDSYQTQDVTTDYSKIETQNCYLLRYFLPYSNLLTEELNKIKVSQNINIFGNKNRLNKVDNLVASFFGCGPAPEIIGLLRHLESALSPSIKNLQVNLFDINSKTWKHSIELLKKYVIPNFNSCYKNLNIKSYVSDFSSSKFGSETNSNRIKKSNLLVFQNCLNEINEDIQRDQVIENIGFIIYNMPKNSIIIFIDQSIGTYKSSTDFILERIQSKAKEKKRDLSILQSHQDNQFSCREINKKMPEMVNNYLFYTGYQRSAEADKLILRSNLEYSSLIIERQ